MEKKTTAEKKVTSTQDYNKRRGPSHGTGNWTRRNDDNGAMTSRLDLSIEEISGETISEETTGTTKIFGTMSTERDHRTCQTRTNLEIGKVTMTIHDRLQHRNKNPLSRNSAINPDQIRLTFQCLTGLESETRATIYPTTRNSQLPPTVTNQK